MNMLSHFNRVICTMIRLRQKMELDNVLCILYQFLSSFFLKDRFLSEYGAGKGPILLGAELSPPSTTLVLGFTLVINFRQCQLVI